jgi:hypothetical protein
MAQRLSLWTLSPAIAVQIRVGPHGMGYALGFADATTPPTCGVSLSIVTYTSEVFVWQLFNM